MLSRDDLERVDVLVIQDDDGSIIDILLIDIPQKINKSIQELFEYAESILCGATQPDNPALEEYYDLRDYSVDDIIGILEKLGCVVVSKFWTSVSWY